MSLRRDDRIDRRTFMFGAFAAGVQTASADTAPKTFSQWLAASAKAREAALASCLDRIRVLDGDIKAWVQVLPQSPTGKGRLLGIPFGVKDIIETKGLATEYGSPIYKGRLGTADAAIVRQLRERGGVLLGKTHSTAFAYSDPAPTRNPRDLAHTPGGSSSGSAAAVAAGMVPVALGTQTGGSVLRPASYCGVTGFKTTYGLLSMDGVLPFARSLDTLGFFTHTAADMLAFWGAIGQPVGRAEDVPLAVPDPAPDVEPDMAYAYRDAVARLLKARYTIRPIPITAMLTKLRDAQRTIMFYEGARFHEERFKEYGTRLGSMGDLVRDGLQISAQQFDDATRYVAECRKTMTALFKETPIVLVPAATGSAPRGLASTGDSRMNGPWTALGTPAVSIPIPMPSGLPLGLQLTGNHGDDARVLQTAARLERTLRTILTP
jgi:Asp-tRNA(Asn)/Glu-tRNA(Gln) amidotransferase A subunit family amidase